MNILKNVTDLFNAEVILFLNKVRDAMRLCHEGQNMFFVCQNGFTQRKMPFWNRFEGGTIHICGLDSVGHRGGRYKTKDV